MSAATEESASFRRDRAFTVTLTLLVQGFQSLSLSGVALFLPRIREDLGLSFTEAGSLAAASTLAYALMQIPVGYLSDRLGPKRLILAGVIAISVFSLTFGLLQTYWQAVLNQAASGLARSLLFTPGLMLVTNWFPPGRRATAMGLFVAVGFSLSIIINISGPFLADELGWRVVFIGASAAGLVASILFIRLAKDRPRVASQRQVGVLEAVRLFRQRILWVVAGIQYVRLAVVTGISFWLPTFLVEEHGQSLIVAGLVMALAGAVSVPSNFLGGYFSDRLRNPPLVIGFSLTMVALTITAFGIVDNIALLILLIALNGAFVQMYFGPLFALPIDLLGPRTAGVVSGFANFFANMGGFTFAYTLGVVKDATGSFDTGFYSLAAACLLGVLLTVILAHLRRQQLSMRPQAQPS